MGEKDISFDNLKIIYNKLKEVYEKDDIANFEIFSQEDESIMLEKMTEEIEFLY